MSPSVSPSNYYLPSPGYAPNVPQGVPHRDMDMMLPHHIGDYIELISVILIIYWKIIYGCNLFYKEISLLK